MMANTLSTTTNRRTLATNKILNTATTNPIDTANTWRQLNPTTDPLASLTEDCYHTVTNAYATNIKQATKNPHELNPSSPYNPPPDYKVQSLLGGSDTGAQKQGAFRITQSQDKANETKTKLTVSANPFSLHHSSGNRNMYWTEKYEGPMKPNTLTSSHALKCSSQSISN
jgi:hypothetical protein